MTEIIILDGISDVPWAIREGRTYTMTEDVTLAGLVVEEGVILDGEFALTCDSLVNRGTVHGYVKEAGDLRNEGYIDPRSMYPWQ